MSKNILCPCCSNVIAIIKDERLVLHDMKVLSIVEANIITNKIENIKCRCGSWLLIGDDNKISINYQRKGQDALYSANNAVYKNKK